MNSISQSTEELTNSKFVEAIKNDNTQICNICLESDEQLICLNTGEEGQALGDMFISLTSIQIDFNELLSFQICTACKNNVVFCCQFKVKCQNSFYGLHEDIKLTQIRINNINEESSIPATDISEAQRENKEYLETNIKPTDVSDIHDLFEVKKEEILEIHHEIEYLDDNIFDEVKCSKNSVQINREFTKFKKRGRPKKDIKERQSRIFHPCSICNKKFVSALNLKAHMKTHKSVDKKFIACRHCNEKFASEHDLKVHSALHNKDNNWNCSKCLKEFLDRAAFRRHIRRHYNTKEFACDWCEKQFAELCALRRHEHVHTGQIRENRHKCTQCDKRYASNYQLKIHMSQHTGVRPCTCDTCGKGFPSTRLLNSHKLTHSDHKPFSCPLCDKRFRHESTRKTHLLTHTGEKPYVCSVCGKTFRQNSNLTLHMRSHTGEKPYTCEVCRHTFRSTSALTTHMSRHNKDKVFACTVCGKKFLRQSLTNHMRLHTGERAHACPACPKRFLTASRLKEHSRIHTDEKPYQCKFCGTQFKKQISLKNHVKRHDGKTDNEKMARKTISKTKIKKEILNNKESSEDNSDMNLQITEVPIEVSEELVLQNDGNVNTELIVIEEELVSPQLLDGITVKLYHINQGLVKTQD